MAFTEAQVRSWFTQAGVKIASPYETEAQALARITSGLNQGTRTEADVKAGIASRAQPGFEFDPDAALQYGGEGSGELQATTGSSGQVWHEPSTGRYWLVFHYPGTDAPLMYAATESEITAKLNNRNFTPDRTLNPGDVERLGGLQVGVIDDVDVGDPFRALQENMAAEIRVAPWLGDPDVLALVVEAALEGRQITDAEWALTDWYQNHSESERQWMILSNRDPATAAQLVDSNIQLVRSQIEAAGGANPPDDLVRHLATQFTSGAWTQTTLRNQIRAVTDPASGVAIDPTVSALLAGRTVDTTRQYEEDVRADVLRYLGPQFGAWSESQIRDWAGRLRNDPDAETELIEMLRNQRMALFPEYTNPSLTYEDIAAPWRGLFQNEWGQMVSETDPLFNQVVRLNDVAEASKLLRAEGLKRGNRNVMDSLISTVGRVDAAEQVRTVNG